MIIIASMMKMARKGFNIYNICHGHNGFNTSYCPKTPSNAYSDDHNECDGLIIYECCNLSYIMNNYYINMVIMAGLAISAVMAALTVYGRYGLNDFNYFNGCIFSGGSSSSITSNDPNCSDNCNGQNSCNSPND